MCALVSFFVCRNLIQAARSGVKSNLEKGLTSIGPLGQRIAPMLGVSIAHHSVAESTLLWDSAFKGEVIYICIHEEKKTNIQYFLSLFFIPESDCN